jgi:hypothetical protein
MRSHQDGCYIQPYFSDQWVTAVPPYTNLHRLKSFVKFKMDMVIKIKLVLFERAFKVIREDCIVIGFRCTVVPR